MTTETKPCVECGLPVAADAPQGLCPKCLVKRGLETETGSSGSAPTTPVHPAPAPVAADLAQLFPQLEILDLLGQGGMGVVYKARQPRLDRVVALKILPAEAGRDPAFAERFSREAKALARLNHPGIVGVYDFGKAGDFYYFLMEYVDGVNLGQMIRAQDLESRQALNIVMRICEALQYAHDEGIVHRDIKPGNILLDKKGRVKIADFGLAKLLGRAPADRALTQTQQVMGTPQYMAPEQMERPQTVDHRADIYSLGVVLYEMLTGELPIGRFAPPSQKVQVDVRLDEVVLKTLEKEPERRYQQASHIKTDIESVTQSPPPAGAGDARMARTSADRETARQRIHAPAIGLVIAAGLDFLPIVVVVIPMIVVFFLRRSMEVLPVFFFLIPIALYGLLAIIKGIGALQMLRLQSYGWAWTAAILGMIPTGIGWLLGLPMGIWACALLTKPEIRSAFASNQAGALGREPRDD